MKLSRWNTYIPTGPNSGLIFNALTDTFVAVKENSHDFKHAIVGNLEEFSAEFHKQMSEAGAIVPDEKDEVGELQRLIESYDTDDSLLQLIINPTLDCNFHCWYCYEEHQNGSCMSADTIDNIIKFAENKIGELKNLKYLSLSFFGGEPLLRFNEVVRPLVERISKLCSDNNIKFAIHFTSNSFLLTDRMIEFLKDYETSFQITLDGGRTNHNNTRFGKGGTPSFDTILENVRKLADNGCFVILRINYTTKVVDSTSEIVEIISTFPECCKQNIQVDYQRVWQDKGDNLQDSTYTKVRQLRKELKKAGFRTANNRLMNNVSNSCYADKDNEYLINFNGDIFACTARDFKTESRLGRLSDSGEILWNEQRRDLRRNIRFTKQICHECRIAPLCGGGCRTKGVEQMGHDKCNLGFTDEEIDEIIIERFEDRFMNV